MEIFFQGPRAFFGKSKTEGNAVFELSKRRWGGWGVDFFCRKGVEKEVGGRILSSIIEERGKLHNKSSLWCKKSAQRSPYCFPQQYLIIISRAPPFALFYYLQ